LSPARIDEVVPALPEKLLKQALHALDPGVLAVSLPRISDDSRDRCLALTPAAHLVTITSMAEDDFVRTFAGARDLWTGGNDRAVEGTYVWSDGEPFAYANWMPNEPNDTGHVENCIVLRGTVAPGGLLDDHSCAATFGFVCER